MLAGPWTDARDGIMIVLANDYNANGILGPGSYWRTVYAIHAWREGGFKEIVLSGPSIIVDPMQDFLIKSGVPASAIVMETESRTTHESAYYVMRLLSGSTDRKVLLRSDYHMYRAYHAFLKSGLNIAPRPFPDAAKRIGSIPERWPVFTGLVIETVKIGWYRLHGWI